MNPGPAESEVAAILVALGCPADRVGVMASQLLKRSGQLARERSWSEPEALAHLLHKMAGGWAAQARGIDASVLAPSPAAPGPGSAPPRP